jgi:hypothetical protein
MEKGKMEKGRWKREKGRSVNFDVITLFFENPYET